MRGLFFLVAAVLGFGGCIEPVSDPEGSILIEGVDPDAVIEPGVDAIEVRQDGASFVLDVLADSEVTGALVVGVSLDWGVQDVLMVPMELGFGSVTLPLSDPCGQLAARSATVAVWTSDNGDPWVAPLSLVGESYGSGEPMEMEGLGSVAVHCGRGPTVFDALDGAMLVSTVTGTLRASMGAVSINADYELDAGHYTFEPSEASSDASYVLTVTAQ